MISLKQINNQRVKPIPIPSDLDKRPIKGYDICPEIYSNIFLTAKKKSGKTSALFKIMKECCDKKTIIIIFCSTIYKDENWIEIRKYFEKKGNDIRVYTSLYEDGEDQLQKLIDELSNEAQEEDQKNEEKEELPVNRCEDILERLTNMHLAASGRALPEPEPEKKKKVKKSKSLLTLLKKNRHYKSKIIISSQWLHDLLPESRKQIDVYIIFAGFSMKKIEECYKDSHIQTKYRTETSVHVRRHTQRQISLLLSSRVFNRLSRIIYVIKNLNMS